MAWRFVAHCGRVVLMDQCTSVGSMNTKGADAEGVITDDKSLGKCGARGCSFRSLFFKFFFNYENYFTCECFPCMYVCVYVYEGQQSKMGH